MCTCFNNAICQASVTHFNEYYVNVRCKVVLPSLPDSTFSVPPISVATTPTYQRTNLTSKLAFVCKSGLSASHLNTSPTPAVIALNSYWPLHVCDVTVLLNVLCHVRKVSPSILHHVTTTSTSHALIKKFPHFHQQLIITQKKSVFCNYITSIKVSPRMRLLAC